MIRRVVSAVLACILLGSTIMLAETPQVTAQPATSVEPGTTVQPGTTAEGANDIAACVQSGRSISALFLLDRSGSLGSGGEGTDPDGVRYDGLRLALQNLERITRADGEPVTVEVAVSAFDHQYSGAGDVVDWTRINAGDDQDFGTPIDEIVEQARERTQAEGGTDFTAALDGAYEDLRDRGSRGVCRVVFWFTDGFDEAGGIAGACQPNAGVVDRLRERGITIVGLQLGPPQDDLEAIATGRSPYASCGLDPIPSDWAKGIYIQADDSAALRRLFGNLGNIINGCIPQEERRNVIDPGVGGMNLTIPTSSRMESVRLDAPDGTVIDATTTGSTTAGGYAVNAQSDETYTSLNVDFPPGSGAGAWAVSAGQGIPLTDMDFCVFSGLHLARVDPESMPAAGGPAEIVFRALDSNNEPADLDIYQEVAVGASVVAHDGQSRRATAERRGNEIVLQFESEAVDGRLQGRVMMVPTTVSGLELAPLAADEGIAMALSRDYPSVSPVTEVDLGTAHSTEPASAQLSLVGSPNGPTQVCLDEPTQILVPDDVTGQYLDAPNGCIDVARDETRTVSISVTPPEATVGSGEALLPVRLIPVAGSAVDGMEAPVDVPVVWRYDIPIHQGMLWTVLLLVVLLSIALPLLALSIANYMTAKFSARNLVGAEVPVMIGDDGPRRRQEVTSGRVLDLFHAEPIPLPGRRRFRYGPLEFVAKASLRPWIAPTFTVRPVAPGMRVLSSTGPGDANGSQAPVSPGLGFVVVAVVDETDLRDPTLSEVPATLVFLCSDDSIRSDRLDGLMNQRMTWHTITEEWRSALEGHHGGRSSGPSGGPGGRGTPRGGSGGGGSDMSHLDDGFDDSAGRDDFGDGSMDHLDKGYEF